MNQKNGFLILSLNSLRSFAFLIFLIIGGKVVAATQPLQSKLTGSFHIALDPGHGGSDKGAIHSSVKESELVLKVAKKIRELLEKNPEIRVTMTRKEDTNISLSDRVKVAENEKVDIFVSLHANAATDQRAKGVEFFFQNNLPADDEGIYMASLENQANATLAQEISSNTIELSKKSDVAAIVEDLRRHHRMMSSLQLSQTLTRVWQSEDKPADKPSPATIKQAPFYVISKTTMPAVLIEVGFLTNPKEVKKLAKQDYQERIAKKIYTAIISFKEKMDKPEAKTLN